MSLYCLQSEYIMLSAAPPPLYVVTLIKKSGLLCGWWKPSGSAWQLICGECGQTPLMATDL